MSKRTLIIPDVHNRWELVEKLIKRVSPDETVLLGDYFDDFGDDATTIADVADWLHWSVNQPNRIHLSGNHDTHYRFRDYEQCRCAGYSQPKSIVINDFVTATDWNKLVLYYVLDNKWLLTHAGVHPAWVNPGLFTKTKIVTSDIQKIEKKLKKDSEEFLISCGRKKLHWFDIPGRARCRNSPYYGGLLWCDWEDEFWPTRGLHQIVGHTPSRGNPTWKFLKEGDPRTQTGDRNTIPELSKDTSYNVCLDSQPGSRFYAIYDDKAAGGGLTILENFDVIVHETRRID